MRGAGSPMKKRPCVTNRKTTMNETLILILAGGAGFLLGTFFFGGLWWTVRKGLSSDAPALWFLGSRLLRMGVALAGFYSVGHGEWPRLVGCLFGFSIARFAVTLLTRPPLENLGARAKEVSHAS